ncbi:MAG: hypothetical protein DMG74_07925 [Acidobacteria bacterium]|nr:MAG: hypothetical protein DMG74_07925 [Acidobacteriota bacterium]
MDSLFALLAYSTADFWIPAAIGTCAGIFLFVHGFRMLARKRLILNTPISRIRSASIGLVEVNGVAIGPYTINAPITGLPCFYYRTLVWQLKQSGKGNKWQQIIDESLHVPFYLDDNTGRLLVNPQGADLEIHRDFHDEFNGPVFFNSDLVPESVRSFLMAHGVSSDQRIRIDEYCIKPKNTLFILGTLAENPGLTVSPKPVGTLPSPVASFNFNLPSGTKTKVELALNSARITMLPAGEEVFETSLQNGRGLKTELVRLSSDRPTSSLNMTQQEKIAAALMKAGITNPAAWEAAGLNGPASAVATATAAVSGTSPAGNGSPDAETEQFDLQPKTVLMKGDHNPAFFISWRSRRDVVQELNWKSALCIWGAPGLILACLYVLVKYFGWR